MTETGKKKVLDISVGVLRRKDDGKVYVAERGPGRDYAGFWEFPGGKVESDEEPVEALYRELSEELGATTTHLTNVKKAAYFTWSNDRYYFRMHCFVVDVEEGFTPRSLEAHSDQTFIDWYHVSALNLLASNKRLIDLVSDEIEERNVKAGLSGG